MTAPPKKKPPKSNAGLATHWRVGERTIKRWRTKGAPLHDDDAMAAWAPSQKLLPAGFLARLEELKGGNGGSPPANSDAEWKAFIEQTRQESTESPRQSLAAITKARDYTAFRFMEAAKKNDKGEMKFYAGLLATFDGVVHDALTRAKKLGLDQGDLVQRSEVERIVVALCFWLLKSTDAHLDILASKFKAAGFEAEKARAILEPELLSLRFLEPFSRAAKSQSGVNLPSWLVDKMAEAAGNFIESGEEAFRVEQEAAS